MWPHCDINAIFAEKEGQIATIFCESELNCKLLLRLAVWLVDLLLCLFSPIVGHSECLPCLFLQKVKHKTWSFLGHSRLPQFIVYYSLNLLYKLFYMQPPPPHLITTLKINVFLLSSHTGVQFISKVLSRFVLVICTGAVSIFYHSIFRLFIFFLVVDLNANLF